MRMLVVLAGVLAATACSPRSDSGAQPAPPQATPTEVAPGQPLEVAGQPIESTLPVLRVVTLPPAIESALPILRVVTLPPALIPAVARSMPLRPLALPTAAPAPSLPPVAVPSSPPIAIPTSAPALGPLLPLVPPVFPLPRP